MKTSRSKDEDMTTVIDKSIQAYQKHQHLKLAAKDIGIPWQTLYTHLRKAGISVTGNKLKYGSDSDKLAAKTEDEFKRIVTFAHNQNNDAFQSKIDFYVGAYGVDIKSSRYRKASAKSKVLRWSFSIKKQEVFADFFVCFGWDALGQEIQKILLVPAEMCRFYTSISISTNHGKWSDYEVTESELREFFNQMIQIPKEQP